MYLTRHSKLYCLGFYLGFLIIINSHIIAQTYGSFDPRKNTTNKKNSSIKNLNKNTVDLMPPQMIYPSDNEINVPIVPQFIFSTIPKANRYDLEVATDKYFFNTISNSYEQFETEVSDSTIKLFPGIRNVENMRNDKIYYWRVKASSTEYNEESPWSEPFKYTTKSAGNNNINSPLLISPTDGSTIPWLQVDYKWSKEPSSLWYQLQWSTNSWFDSFSYMWLPKDTLQYKTNLKPTKDYYWRIVAYDTESLSEFSLTGKLKTGNNIVFTEDDYIFDDGSASDDYENDAELYYLIKPSNNGKITITFLSFNTEKDCDWVTIYDGDNINTPIIVRFSGNEIPSTIVSLSNSLLIKFETDWWSTDSGWKIKYETNIEEPYVLGIDVSYYQGNIDWEKVYNVAKKKFVFIRATAGGETKDLQFEKNITEAQKQKDIFIGVYHFAYPQYFSAKKEAEKFLSVARPYIGEGFLPPVIDVENSYTEDSFPYLLGKEELSQWINDWCSEVRSVAGADPIIYAPRDDYARGGHLENSISRFLYWVPTDGKTPDYDPGDLGIWSNWNFQQYYLVPKGDTVRNVIGINYSTDLDSFNGSLEKLKLLLQRQPVNVEKKDILLENYYLSQNYPNPFNPTTAIKFTIPISQFVTLKIYDLLGREMTTLANEEKLAGNYEVKFNGSNIPSGVYFYRIQAGSFSQTRKLTLVK